MDEVPGSRGAAPIFRGVMEYALTERGEPVESFVRPEGLVERSVCWESGLLPTPECGRVVSELFVAGTEPTQYDTVWRAFEINKENGKLATVYTPPELRERRVYQIYPPEAADWVREQGIPQPPVDYDETVGSGTVDPEVAIISPTPFSSVKGVVEITGNARLADGFRSYRIEFGEGVNPGSWTQIGSEHGEQVGEGLLERWDTAAYNGLYSLRVVVTRGDGSTRENAVQVTVDNAPPAVRIEYPNEGAEYITEDDEWVSITADVTDDWAMDRVDFYLDGRKIGSSTVAPFSRRWDLELFGQGAAQTITRTVTLEDGSVISQSVPAATTTVPELDADGQPTGRTFTAWENGFGYLVDASGNYTETHLNVVKAYDRAGNEAESEPVRIYVARKPQDKDEEDQVGRLPSPPELPPPRRESV
jgi:hypothetical protein